jgi:hypothetical protein
MGIMHGENLLPWLSRGQPLKVRTTDEMKQMILGNHEVKEVIASMVRERAKKLADHF